MKFIQYGAGNIGRGFIGQTFSNAGYEVVFIDVNMEVVDRINADRQYPVKIVSAKGVREEIIRNVRAVDGRDVEAVAREISDADLMATAVGVNILPRVVPVIAKGLAQRWEAGNGPLDIILCENLIDADKYMRKLLNEQMNDARVNTMLGLVEASIGRMVPVMTPEMQGGNILRVIVEEYDTLPVDQAAFVNPIPPVKKLMPFTPFEFYIRRKLFIHNCGHALCAYLGYSKGVSRLAEVMQDAEIKLIAQRAMSEAALALSRKYDVPFETLLDHVDDLLYRFANPYLGDTVERVGKDTIRKLSRNDRLTGAALACADTGTDCVYIPIGMAAALLFHPEGDDASEQVYQKAQKSPMQALQEATGVDNANFLALAMEYYHLIQEEGIGAALRKAEAVKDDLRRKR